MYHAKPIGVPALISLYEKMANDNPLLRQLKVSCRLRPDHAKYPSNGPLLHAVGAGPSNRDKRPSFCPGSAARSRGQHATPLISAPIRGGD